MLQENVTATSQKYIEIIKKKLDSVDDAMITLYLVALKYLTASGSNPKASGTCGHTFGKYQTCFLAAENLNDFKSLMEKKTRKNCAFFFF